MHHAVGHTLGTGIGQAGEVRSTDLIQGSAPPYYRKQLRYHCSPLAGREGSRIPYCSPR